MKKDKRGVKIDSNFALKVFSKKEAYVVHISFYNTRGWNRQVIPDRVVQWSIPWVVFLWCPPPKKFPLVCGFSPFLCMITLNPLPLRSSRSNKYNNYDKATYIVSSDLCQFTCPQAADFPWNLYPQIHISVKGVSQIHPHVSGANFSNNISIPQVKVNIKKTEDGTTFEISSLSKPLGEKLS